jgi:hypothetical protein
MALSLIRLVVMLQPAYSVQSRLGEGAWMRIKALKSDVEKRGSNFRCTFLASTFSGSAESAALFNAAYR